jgi:hypothetical protein
VEITLPPLATLPDDVTRSVIPEGALAVSTKFAIVFLPAVVLLAISFHATSAEPSAVATTGRFPGLLVALISTMIGAADAAATNDSDAMAALRMVERDMNSPQ